MLARSCDREIDIAAQRAVNLSCNSSTRQISGFGSSAPKWFSYSEASGDWLSNDPNDPLGPLPQPRDHNPRGPGTSGHWVARRQKRLDAASSRAAGVGFEESTQAGRADDFAHFERDLRIGWLLTRRW